MRRFSILYLFFSLLFLGGCATLKTPVAGDKTYPFRAQVSVKIDSGPEKIEMDGALLLKSREEGLMQFYGPGGFAIYTAELKDGKFTLKNIWGRVVKEQSIPFKDVVTIFAGEIPSSAYIFKQEKDGLTFIRYLWGRLILNEENLPWVAHVNSEPQINIVIQKVSDMVYITVVYGTDIFEVKLKILEGGNWGSRVKS